MYSTRHTAVSAGSQEPALTLAAVRLLPSRMYAVKVETDTTVGMALSRKTLVESMMKVRHRMLSSLLRTRWMRSQNESCAQQAAQLL